MPQLMSIQVGKPRWHGTPGAGDPMDRPWESGFFKEPIVGPVAVTAHGVAGDGQADLVNHGGPEKAILGYSADHYPDWRRELDHPDLPFGAFGENLTITDSTERDVCVGDVWRIGPVVLAVTQPRQPCWKLARRWKVKDLPARVIETGRGGWYFRVIVEGTIESGMSVELVERPNPEWTIHRANRVLYFHRTDAEVSRALADVPGLSMSWREAMIQRSG